MRLGTTSTRKTPRLTMASQSPFHRGRLDGAVPALGVAACACAGEWTEEMAAEWWRSHGETVSVRPPANTDNVPTRQLTPLPV